MLDHQAYSLRVDYYSVSSSSERQQSFSHPVIITRGHPSSPKSANTFLSLPKAEAALDPSNWRVHENLIILTPSVCDVTLVLPPSLD